MVKIGIACLALLAVGCVGELVLTNAPVGGGGPDGGGGGGTAGEIAFNNNVFPSMTARTCTTCHTDATCAVLGLNHCFLGTGQAASAYTSLKASIYLGTTPAASTFVSLGAHTGPGFCQGPNMEAGDINPDPGCTADQITPINDWIVLEAGGGL